MSGEVRRAADGDVPALAEVLAAAFADYPWTRWVVDHADHERRLRALYDVYLRLAVRLGEVWTTDDHAGAAAWLWTGDAAVHAEHLQATGAGAQIAELAGDRGAQAAAAEPLLEPHLPAEPHWRLEAVGVAPGRQGAGLGTALLEPMLRRCDDEGLPAALETSSADNVRLYERLGFRVTAEVSIPHGPRVWVMRRVLVETSVCPPGSS